jgi:hypothetical protein
MVRTLALSRKSSHRVAILRSVSFQKHVKNVSPVDRELMFDSAPGLACRIQRKHPLADNKYKTITPEYRTSQSFFLKWAVISLIIHMLSLFGYPP